MYTSSSRVQELIKHFENHFEIIDSTYDNRNRNAYCKLHRNKNPKIKMDFNMEALNRLQKLTLITIL